MPDHLKPITSVPRPAQRVIGAVVEIPGSSLGPLEEANVLPQREVGFGSPFGGLRR
jgi:hypothetical protein